MNELRYHAQPEETLYFDLPHAKGLRIKGTLRGSLEQPLAIIMHGRPGAADDLLPYLGARYLYEKGIATLRLSMYDFEEGTRDLVDCTLQDYIADFEEVVRQLRAKGVRQLAAIGHSYGGLTILGAKAELDAAVLWDPSHGAFWAEGHHKASAKKYHEVKVGEYIIATSGKGWMYPASSEAADCQLGDTSDWAAKEYPLQIISAGAGVLTPFCERYIQAANEPKRHIVIQEAHHPFKDSDAVLFELLERTYEWLKEYLLIDIHKAAGIIIKDRQLLVERSQGKDVFIAPGGKVERGETPEQAVIRELKEEFQLTLTPADLKRFGTFYAEAAGGHNAGKRLRMDVFMVKDVTEVHPDSEVEEIRWISSKIPAGIEVGSIFAHNVLPKLKAQGLVD